ncbi:MAG: hypothetical protein HUU46_21260 [Candidatus Hydrogenedentes bacterium]|nr:hypothetical protein [Candidatus Hydrogenedentota bacterium]
MDPLMAALRRLRLRLFITQWTRAVVISLIASTALACGWLLVARLFPTVGPVEPVSLVLVVLGLLAATTFSVWKRPSVLKAALEADKRLGLHERITSSLQLEGVEGAMVDAVHADARAQLARLNYTGEFPFTTPRAIRWLAFPVVLFLVGYVLLPEFDLFGQRKREAEAKAKETAMRVEAQRLEEIVKLLKELGLEDNADLAALTGEIERIAEQLKSGELSEKQAFAKLTNLTDRLAEQREKLGEKAALPNLANEISKLEFSKDLAENVQKGEFGEAQQKAQELAEKALSENATPEEKEKIATELANLANMLGEMDPELAKALSELSAALKMDDIEAAKKAMEGVKLSLEDLKKLVEQLEKLSKCEGKLGECKNKMYCSACKGMCKGDCDKYLMGLGKVPGLGQGGANGWGAGQGGLYAGWGQGNREGEAPGFEASADPTMVPGEVTKGKILATIMQRAAPDGDESATIDYSSQAIVQIQQQSEEALTKEEIPPGAKEFVRQYFGSLEPENRRQVSAPGPDPATAETPVAP